MNPVQIKADGEHPPGMRSSAIQMIFDTSQRLALTVICEKANLVEPDTGQDERSISTISFDLALLQAQCLNDPLEEQFVALFAIVEQVVPPRPSN